MGGTHPCFEGPKRVFDGLSPHPHGLGHAVKPILHGKGDSWDNLDVVSSVVEVSASAPVAGPAIAKLVYGIEHGGSSSWRDILLTVRNSVGDSTFGVSGVRDNCYSPTGSRCN